MMVVAIVVMMTCKLGPAVSLNGSPTVSPVTAALCAVLPLPERASGLPRVNDDLIAASTHHRVDQIRCTS